VDEDAIAFGREVLRLEAEAVGAQMALLDERFLRAVELVERCAGHVVTTGMGKSGIIAQKISATLASTGTPSIYLHPAEAIHGDLGRVGPNDVVIALSRSGTTEELKRLIEPVKRIGARLIAMTGDPESVLAQKADCLLLLARAPEACPIGLAPTTSTTAQLALGDALAMAVAKRRKFSREDFARYHPGGALGRSLITVAEVMRDKAAWPPAQVGTITRAALLGAGGLGRRPGALVIVDANGRIAGLLTDGDIRRHVLRDPGFLDRPIDASMTKGPKTIRADQLAAEAWHLMNQHDFDEMPVVDGDGRYLGLLDVQDLLEVGIGQGG
jgi:arabinose-5-phosphate isomerase